MSQELYPSPDADLSRKRRALAPDTAASFAAFSKQALAEGELPARTKQLIAVAVEHATQCPYCIRGHTRGALRAGASEAEVMEAIWIAAEKGAGAAYAHSTIALSEKGRIEEHETWLERAAEAGESDASAKPDRP